jgi:hypothetical protein
MEGKLKIKFLIATLKPLLILKILTEPSSEACSAYHRAACDCKHLAKIARDAVLENSLILVCVSKKQAETCI